MKVYKIKIKLHAHSYIEFNRPEPFTKNDIYLILDDDDNVERFIENCYGGIYDFEILEIIEINSNGIHLSINLMKTHAKEIIKKLGL